MTWQLKSEKFYMYEEKRMRSCRRYTFDTSNDPAVITTLKNHRCAIIITTDHILHY